ncbi:RsmE family RNA methyltransferase [Alienimonas chondri]|uniref:Ribosomal RNA small subunit methyltransferase E n=1 Tax=Alienimonas chondri TaxID=2681879 RepID=A0ABX1VGK3_9PLAN|nr:RsmE family RNA methyltransferase [Alienimonas chondri]NNJ26408.1 Ribosomal RNA small subunit methyltransferase E [Alienimonas chondri]
MSAPRFFAPPPLAAGPLTLAGPEAKHLTAVLRMGPGDAIELFDGEGHRAAATVQAVRGKGAKTVAELHCEPPRFTEPPASPLTLAVAAPKGDRFRWLIEKATELGVARIVPLLCERSTVDPSGGKLDKLRATALAACKQCRRDRLPAIEEPQSLGSFLQTCGPATLFHVVGDRFAPPAPGPHAVLIGPEGGFTKEEVQAAASAGVRLASLPTPILRTETAAIAAAAVFASGGTASAQ